MQWTILIIPMPTLLLIFMLVSGLLILCVGWYLWLYIHHTRNRYPTSVSACCVCGAVPGHEVRYQDETGNLVEEHFCSECLGKLLSPAEER